jgi:hypothetical protein
MCANSILYNTVYQIQQYEYGIYGAPYIYNRNYTIQGGTCNTVYKIYKIQTKKTNTISIIVHTRLFVTPLLSWFLLCCIEQF